MSLSAELGYQIHQRLLEGDPVASSELAVACLGVLVARMKARFPDISDETLIHDAAADAILSYAENPSAYNPAKSGLLTYLTMSARGDLLNALAKERRRRRRESSLELVEQSPHVQNKLQEHTEHTPLEEQISLDGTMYEGMLEKVHEAILAPQDQQLLLLLLDGVRETTPYSVILGIEGLDFREQQRIVKQHKDRLKKRLERLGVRLRERGN